MKDGGTLTISAHNVVLNGKPDGLKGEHVALQVTDTGNRHVAGDHGARVRAVLHDQELRRRDRPGPQPGVRLRKADSAAASRVNSQVGKGATFTFTCPPAAALRPRKASSNGVHALGRVLIVEDDTLVAELAAGMLAELGFETRRHSQREGSARAPGRRRKAQAHLFRHRHARRDQRHRACAQGARPLPRAADPADHRLQRSRSADRTAFPVLQKPYEMNSLPSALGKVLKRESLLS